VTVGAAAGVVGGAAGEGCAGPTGAAGAEGVVCASARALNVVVASSGKANKKADTAVRVFSMNANPQGQPMNVTSSIQMSKTLPGAETCHCRLMSLLASTAGGRGLPQPISCFSSENATS
jgi:hypothetical protein